MTLVKKSRSHSFNWSKHLDRMVMHHSISVFGSVDQCGVGADRVGNIARITSRNEQWQICDGKGRCAQRGLLFRGERNRFLTAFFASAFSRGQDP